MIDRLKKHKELITLIILLLIAVFAMYLPSWLKGDYFIGGGDVKTQWYEFYTLSRREIINAIRSKQFPFYSWVLFLGGNLWGSKLSYGLFDIFNIPFYLTSINYFTIYEIQNILKVLVAGISFYFLIDYVYGNKKASLIGGLCYGLSSFAIYFVSQPGFLSFYAIVPFYLLGMEKNIKENRKVLFVLSTFILLITNYYLFFSLSLFSPIYYLYRYINIKGNFDNVVLNALKIIGLYLIGALLSGIFILPAFFYIVGNERVGSLNTSLSFNDIKLYLHLLINQFVPSQTYIYGNDIFNSEAHTLKEICMFSSSLISVLLTQFLLDKDKRFKISTLIVYVLLLLLIFTPLGNASMMGFSEVCFRWVYIVIAINIIVICRYISFHANIDKKCLNVTLLIEGILIVTCFIFAVINKQVTISEYRKQLIIFVVTILFSILFVYILNKQNRALIAIVYIQLLLSVCIVGINSRGISINNKDINGVTNVLADNDDYHNLKNYLDSLEEENSNSYYRVYVPYDSLYWSFSRNMNIMYNIQGLMSYDSTYSQSFNDMRDIDPDDIIESIYWEFNIKDDNIMSFLNTKYSITSNKEEIPFSDYEIIDDTYRGTLVVAKNNNYRPLGTTYTKYINSSSYNKDTSLLSDTIIGNNDEIKDMLVSQKLSCLKNIEYYNNHLQGNIDSNEDSFMVLSLPYEDGWKIRVNGEEVKKYKVNGGMIGISIKQGNNFIEMDFIPKGFKEGAIISLFGFVLFVIVLVKEKNRYLD